jgi:hypothetical protein
MKQGKARQDKTRSYYSSCACASARVFGKKRNKKDLYVILGGFFLPWKQASKQASVVDFITE